MLAFHEAQPRICEKGRDSSGLGRWTWMRMQGKHGHYTTIVSAYRPCRNTTDTGSVYVQQQTYWRHKKETRCPIKLFVEHLKKFLKRRIKKGDHVILGIDANEDARTGKVAKFTRELGMHEAVQSLHSDEDPPETC